MNMNINTIKNTNKFFNTKIQASAMNVKKTSLKALEEDTITFGNASPKTKIQNETTLVVMPDFELTKLFNLGILLNISERQQQITNEIEKFNGKVVLKDRQTQQDVVSYLSEATKSDFDEVHTWYEEEKEKTFYGDPVQEKYLKWWEKKFKNPPKNSKIFKLDTPKDLVGIINIENIKRDFRTGNPLSLICGLTVSPEMDEKLKRSGSALLLQSAIEGVNSGTVHVGLNSSPKKEGYYKRFFGTPVSKSYDGTRDYFEELPTVLFNNITAKYSDIVE